MKLFFTYSIAIIISLPFQGFAQKENNVWAFGHHAGLDFNSTGNPTPIVTAIDQWEGTASVADKNTGKLLFYTEGDTVWNANNQIMPNGHIGVQMTNSGTQCALIAPVIDRPGKYYIFSLEDYNVTVPKLYYSIVDMSLNNGLGDIVSGRKRILLEDSLTESMIAITGTCGYWLLVHARYDRFFKAFHVTMEGIDTVPVVSVAGTATPGVSIPAGMLIAAPNGKKITFHTQLEAGGDPTENRLTLFDFDPNTGIVSNPILISSYDFYGVCFSPDNSKLYATTQWSSGHNLYQYDVSSGVAATIQASAINLGLTPAVTTSSLQRGPDGKIYMSNGDYEPPKISVINFPNLSGTACNYVPDAITLASGTYSQHGLPNLVPAIGTQEQTDPTYITISTCKQRYTWNDSTYTASGTYTQIFPHVSGCGDSIVTLKLTITPIVKPTIHIDSFILGVTGTYATYQWIENGTPVPGATSSTYKITGNGNYQVAVTNKAGCSDTSDVYKITNYTGINTINDLTQQIRVYPNPSADRVYIQSPVKVNVTLTDMEGRVVYKMKNAQSLSLANLAEGVYLLRISNTEQALIKVEKIIKLNNED